MADGLTATPASGGRILPLTTIQALVGLRWQICSALELEPATLPIPGNAEQAVQARWRLPADRGTVVVRARRMLTGKTKLNVDWYGPPDDERTQSQRQQHVDKWLREL